MTDLTADSPIKFISKHQDIWVKNLAGYQAVTTVFNWQNVLPWQENDYLVSHFDDDEDAFMDDDDMDEGPIY